MSRCKISVRQYEQIGLQLIYQTDGLQQQRRLTEHNRTGLFHT
jgi:hypothetical protein